MTATLFVFCVIVGSSMLSLRAMNKTGDLLIYSIPALHERLEATNVQQVLTKQDVFQITEQIADKSAFGILFYYLTILTAMTSAFVLWNLPDVGLFLEGLFVITNSFVLANFNHAHRTEKFIQDCGNTILTKVMMNKADIHAGDNSNGPKQNMVDWLDSEQVKLEEEIVRDTRDDDQYNGDEPSEK